MPTTFQKQLLEALNDDLNISLALSLIDEFISQTNETLDKAGKHKNLKREALSNLAFIKNVLGFGVKNPFKYFQIGVDEKTKEIIEDLIEKRDRAKKQKDFALADDIRDKILALNVQIMDTPNGTFWEKV
jgi:cysteinyl-tRNA synthetase